MPKLSSLFSILIALAMTSGFCHAGEPSPTFLDLIKLAVKNGIPIGDRPPPIVWLERDETAAQFSVCAFQALERQMVALRYKRYSMRVAPQFSASDESQYKKKLRVKNARFEVNSTFYNPEGALVTVEGQFGVDFTNELLADASKQWLKAKCSITATSFCLFNCDTSIGNWSLDLQLNVNKSFPENVIDTKPILDVNYRRE